MTQAVTQHSPQRGAPGVVSLAGTQAASCLPVARSLDGHANHSYGLSGRFGPGTPCCHGNGAVSTVPRARALHLFIQYRALRHC